MKVTKSQVPLPNGRKAVHCRFAVYGMYLAAFLLGCESSVEQYKPEPNIYCVLRTNEAAVNLLAGMTVGYYDSISNADRWQGTAGAAVSIEHRGAVTLLNEVADSAGCYRTDSLPLVPGDSYSLSVTYPGGARVTGNTVVPAGFAIDTFRVDTILEVPWPGDTFMRLKMRCAWGESRGAICYLGQMDFWYRSADDSSLERYGPFFTDSRRDSWEFYPFTYRWDTLTGKVDSLPLDRVRIEIKALERNYYDYFSLDYMGGVDPEMMHLDGGVGVFSSACIIDSTLWFPSRSRRYQERPAGRRVNAAEGDAAADGP